MSIINPLKYFELNEQFDIRITEHFKKFPINKEFFNSNLHMAYQIHFLIGILTSLASAPHFSKTYNGIYIRRIDNNLRVFVVTKKGIAFHNVQAGKTQMINPYMTQDEFNALRSAVGPAVHESLLVDNYVYQSYAHQSNIDNDKASIGLQLEDSNIEDFDLMAKEGPVDGVGRSLSVELQKIDAKIALFHFVGRDKQITIEFLKQVIRNLYPKKRLEPHFPLLEPIAKAGFMQGFLFKSMNKFYYSLLSDNPRRTLTYEKGVLSMCLPSNQEINHYAMFNFGKNNLAAYHLPFTGSNREETVIHQVNIANWLNYQEENPREIRLTFENILHNMQTDVLINKDYSIVQEYSEVIKQSLETLGMINPTNGKIKAFLYGLLRTSALENVEVAYKEHNGISSLEAILIASGESEFLLTFRTNQKSHDLPKIHQTENDVLHLNFHASNSNSFLKIHASATSLSEANQCFEFKSFGSGNLKRILQEIYRPHDNLDRANQVVMLLTAVFHDLFGDWTRVSSMENFRDYLSGIFAHHDYVLPIETSYPSKGIGGAFLIRVNSGSDKHLIFFNAVTNQADVAHAVISQGQINLQHSLSLAYNIHTKDIAILGLNTNTAKFNTQNVEQACGRIARHKRTSACPLLHEIHADESKIDDDIIKAIIEAKTPLLKDHLSRVYELSGKIQMGFMVRDLIGDIAQGDIKGIIRDGSFFGGAILAHKVGTLAVDYAAKIRTASLSQSIASFGLCLPKLAFDGYMAYKMVQQVKNKDLIGATANGAFLAIDLAECALQALVTFGVLTLNPLVRPIMAIASTILLVGINIYDTVKKVQQIDHMIHLTTEEYRYEMVREFFHIGTDSYIHELMDEKIANSYLAGQAFKAYPNIKRFLINAAVMKDQDKLTFINNTHIDLTSKHHVQARSRAMPDASNNHSIFCAMIEEPNAKSILQKIIDFAMYSNLFIALRFLLHRENSYPFDDFSCDNAFGISTVDATYSEKTMFLLFEGNDNVTGFQYASNIFNLGDGFKQIKGGDHDDYFIVTGDRVKGILDGANGYDTIDLSEYSKHGTLFIQKNLVMVDQDETSFTMKNIESILGRKNLSDKVQICNQLRLDLAGAADGHDEIDINDYENSMCHKPSNLTIHLQINTRVVCQSRYAKVTYLVTENCDSIVEANEGAHHFYFIGVDLNDIEIRNFGDNRISIRISKINSQLAISGLTNVSLEFENHMKIKISNNGLIAYLETPKSVFDIIEKYNEYIQNNQFITLVAQTMDGTIALNHNHQEIQVNGVTRKMNLVVDYDKVDAHLVGHKKAENYFLFLSKLRENILRKINLKIHTHGAMSHIDLHQFAKLIHNCTNGEYGLKVNGKKSGRNVELELQAVSNNVSAKPENLGKVTITNGIEHARSINIHVYGTSKLKVSGEAISLDPSPIRTGSVTIILPGQLDFDSNVFIDKFAFRMQSYFINGTLMLTNLGDKRTSTGVYTTILFHDFLSFKNKYQTIEISFIDRKLRLKDFFMASSMKVTKDINTFWAKLKYMV